MNLKIASRWILLTSFILGMWVFFDACGGKKEECQVNQDCKTGYYCHKKLKKCLKLIGSCKSDGDCGQGETCQNGKCVQASTEKADISEGTNPDAGPGDTPPSNEGNDTCSGRQTCQQTTDCQQGEKCFNGCCVPPCDANTPCPKGLYCKTDTQECVPCLTDDHCGTTDPTCQSDCRKEKVKRCVNNVCQESSCECPLGTTCDQGTGQCKQGVTCPGGAKPDKNGKCPKKCENANCPAGQTPDPDNNCKCIPKKGICEMCTRDAECGLNGRCVQGANNIKFCTEDCTASRTCSDAKFSCLTLGNYSACMPISGNCPCLGVKCPQGQVCCKSDGACHQCCSDSDCPSGQICRSDGTCGAKDPCKNVSCNPGQQCDPNTGKCVCQSPCPAGTCCDSATQTCSASACGGGGGQCNPPCQSGTQCCNIAGQYQCMQQCPTGPGCKTDSDCKQGEKCCSLFGAMKMCAGPGNPLYLFCRGGGGGCNTDADCPTGQKCCRGLLGKSCKTSCTGFP